MPPRNIFTTSCHDMTQEELEEYQRWERETHEEMLVFLHAAIELACQLNGGSYAISVIEHYLAIESARRFPPQPSLSTKKTIHGSLRTKVYERDAYRCVSCGGHEKLSCDHVIPESKGGPTTYENLQTMCLPCNMRKGNRV